MNDLGITKEEARAALRGMIEPPSSQEYFAVEVNTIRGQRFDWHSYDACLASTLCGAVDERGRAK